MIVLFINLVVIFFLKWLDDLLCKFKCFDVWWIEIGLKIVFLIIIFDVCFLIFEKLLFIILVNVIGVCLLVMIILFVNNLCFVLFNVVIFLFLLVWWIIICCELIVFWLNMCNGWLYFNNI